MIVVADTGPLNYLVLIGDVNEQVLNIGWIDSQSFVFTS
jgi:hypothetical protein